MIERNVMTKQLRDGLTLQRVNFDENYHAWNKLVIFITHHTNLDSCKKVIDSTFVMQFW